MAGQLVRLIYLVLAVSAHSLPEAARKSVHIVRVSPGGDVRGALPVARTSGGASTLITAEPAFQAGVQDECLALALPPSSLGPNLGEHG